MKQKLLFASLFIALSTWTQAASFAWVDLGTGTGTGLGGSTPNAVNIGLGDTGTAMNLDGLAGQVIVTPTIGAGFELQDSTNSDWRRPILVDPKLGDIPASALDFLRIAKGRYLSGSFLVTFTGLEEGWYDLDILSAQGGRDTGTSGLTFTLGGTGVDASATQWTSLVNNINAGPTSSSGWIDGNTATGATLNAGNTRPAAMVDFNADNGAYAQAKGIYVGAGGTLTMTLTGSGGDEYGVLALNALRLTKQDVIPEPSTATLGLLGLTGLLLRRRRSA